MAPAENEPLARFSYPNAPDLEDDPIVQRFREATTFIGFEASVPGEPGVNQNSVLGVHQKREWNASDYAKDATVKA